MSTSTVGLGESCVSSSFAPLRHAAGGSKVPPKYPCLADAGGELPLEPPYLIINLDSNTLNWNGRNYVLSEGQMMAFLLLLRAHEHGGMSVSWGEIRRKCDVGVIRMKRVFMRGRRVNPVFGSLIISGEGRGMYRLAIEPGTTVRRISL